MSSGNSGVLPGVRLSMDSDGLIESVNVGGRRIVEWEGREVETGIWKEPVVGRIGVESVNLEGDDQADRRVHGGPDKAIYAYAIEDYRFWGSELGGVESAPVSSARTSRSPASTWGWRKSVSAGKSGQPSSR